MSEMRSTLNLLSESKYHEVVIKGINLEPEHYIDRKENPTTLIIQLG